MTQSDENPAVPEAPHEPEELVPESVDEPAHLWGRDVEVTAETAHSPLRDPPAEAAPAREARPAKRGGGLSTFLLLVCLILAGGLAYLLTQQKHGAGADVAEVAALKREVTADSQAIAQLQGQVQNNSGLSQQVQSLSDRVDQVERAQASAPAPSANTDDLARKLDDLGSRVAALEQRPAPGVPPAAGTDQGQGGPAADNGGQTAQAAPGFGDQGGPGERAAMAQVQQNIDWLSQRLTRLEQGAGRVQNAAERASRVATAEAAQAALAAGRPVGDVPGAPPEVAKFATTAPPTEADLRRSFEKYAAAARAAAVPHGDKASFLSRAWARLERGITVRQGDQVLLGAPEEGVIEAAEEDVHNGDLTMAVKTLTKLEGPPRDAVQPWIDQTSAVLAARSALAQMAARG